MNGPHCYSGCLVVQRKVSMSHARRYPNDKISSYKHKVIITCSCFGFRFVECSRKNFSCTVAFLAVSILFFDDYCCMYAADAGLARLSNFPGIEGHLVCLNPLNLFSDSCCTKSDTAIFAFDVRLSLNAYRAYLRDVAADPHGACSA
jgi:hypothetical protein